MPDLVSGLEMVFPFKRGGQFPRHRPDLAILPASGLWTLWKGESKDMELKSIAAWRAELESGNLDPALQRLYGADSFGAPKLRQRFLGALEGLEQTSPERTLTGLFSAPGRTEVGGNHTDHQLGWVLGAAVSLDVIGVVSPREDNIIRGQCQG